jgi:hypothetical protein
VARPLSGHGDPFAKEGAADALALQAWRYRHLM